MKNFLIIFQIIISILLIVSILLQAKGTGLGSTFGESQELYRTKRGMEKILYGATILFALLFMLSSLALMILK